jgi:hypothetical protein
MVKLVALGVIASISISGVAQAREWYAVDQ